MCMYLISYLGVLFGAGITCQSEQLWNVIITCTNACAHRKLKARVWFVKLSVHYFLTLLLLLEDVRTVDRRTPGRCQRKWHHKVCARENSVYFEKYVVQLCIVYHSQTSNSYVHATKILNLRLWNSEAVSPEFRLSWRSLSNSKEAFRFMEIYRGLQKIEMKFRKSVT